MQVLFFVTPIFYPIDAVPAPWQTLLKLNPLAWVVQATRDVMLFGSVPDVLPLTLLLVGSAVFALASYAWFMVLKRGFADAL